MYRKSSNLWTFQMGRSLATLVGAALLLLSSLPGVQSSPLNTQSTTEPNKPSPQQSTATVWNQLGPLTQLTRPQNFAGIFCFHVLGIYIALQSAGRIDLFANILLAKPSMWLVFSAVILVSCTSVSKGGCVAFRNIF